MADFSSLKQTIQSYIKQNGNEEITGNILQDVLLAMVSTMGDSAINALASALQDEITARQNQDGTLQGNITAEATARQNADATLQGNISAEATARQQADTALGGRIDGLQTAINGINTKLAEGYIYAGIATPSTNPGTPSGKVFYIAVSSGTYTNFSNLTVAQGINILKYNGSSWSKDVVYAIDARPKKNSQNFVISGGVFDNIGALDVSELNATENPHTLAQYADLSAALAAIPSDYQKGGMSVKFVQSSDNKYIKARCMAQNFTTDVTQWQGVDDTITKGSHNLVESGEIYNQLEERSHWLLSNELKAVAEGMWSNSGSNYVIATAKTSKYDGFLYFLPPGVTKLYTKDPDNSRTYGGAYTQKPYIGLTTSIPAIPAVVEGDYVTYSLPDGVQNTNGFWLLISIRLSAGPVENVLLCNPSPFGIKEQVDTLSEEVDTLSEEVDTLSEKVDTLESELFDSYIDLSNNTNIVRGSLANNITGDFTIMVYAKATMFNYPNFFVTLQQTSSGWYPYYKGEVTFYSESNAKQLTVLVGTGTTGDFSKSLSNYTFQSDNEIFQFAVVRDATNATLKFYINGALVKTVTDVPSDIYVHKNLQMARSYIGNLMIFDSILSDAEILSAYETGYTYENVSAILRLTASNIKGNKLVYNNLQFTATQDTIKVELIPKYSSDTGYGGIVTPSSSPNDSLYSWYVAKEKGTYTNFGGLVVNSSGIYIIRKSDDSYALDTLETFEYKDVVDIVPADIYIMKNKDFIIYSDGIINCLDRGLDSPLDYYVQYVCSIGKLTDRGILFNIATEQTQTLTIRVFSSANKKIVKTITTNIHIISNDFTGKSGNVLVIGDSTEAGNKYTHPMYDYLQANNGENVRLVGSKGSGAYKDEGYGGAQFSTFINGNRKRVYFYLPSGTTETFALYSQYSISGGGETIRVEITEINLANGYVSGGVISGSASNLPASGVMTKILGGGSDTLTYESRNIVAVNPFWDNDNSQLSMTYYKNKIGVATIDVAFVILGINDSNSSDISGIVSSAVTLYNFLITGCNKVVMVLTTCCTSALSGVGGQYGASHNIVNYKNNIFNLRSRLIQEFQGNASRPNASVMMLGGTIDRYYGYSHTTQSVPYYSNETQVVHTDSKHPNTEGQAQGAITLLGHLRQIL